MAIEYYNYYNDFENQMYFQGKLAVLLTEQAPLPNPDNSLKANSDNIGSTSPSS